MSNLLLEQSRIAAVALSALSTDAVAFRALTDAELSELAAATSPLRRMVAARDALIAGEIGRRSARELGQSGLAQRLGYKTPEEMVKVTTGVTGTEANRAVKVGGLLTDGPVWLREVAAAVAGGTLSAAAALSISTGLGEPCEGVTVTDLATAATYLLSLELDPDRLFRRAREVRDEIDEAGIKDREKALYEKRSLKIRKLPDGMTQLVWVMDPETGANVIDLYDRITSPRRGGPRFVNPDDGVISTAITEDARSTEQIASDVFLHLLQGGAEADCSEMLKTGGPTITIITKKENEPVPFGTGTGAAFGIGVKRPTNTPTTPTIGASLDMGAGLGFPTPTFRYGMIEGQTEPLNPDTVQRLICEASTVELTTDIYGNPLDLGRELRLFNRAQRRALSARDGGCMWPGCDSPPSWTEARHLIGWGNGGTTDIANGILLCRHHHLLLHNEHWAISFDREHYWLRPPPNLDPKQTPILLESKNRTTRLTG
jgi:hypothetical protein